MRISRIFELGHPMAAAIDSDNSDRIHIAFVHSGTIVAFLVTVPATLGPISLIWREQQRITLDRYK